MIIEFRFSYTIKTPYLAYFLDYYAKKSRLLYSIVFENSEISLFISGDESELLKFSDESMNLIPNSIFIAKSSVLVADSLPKSNVKILERKFANLTPKMLSSKDKNSSEISPNEFGILSEILVFKDGEFIKVESGNFIDLLNFCYEILLHNQTLKLKNSHGEFSLKSEFGGDFIMPTSFKALGKAFVADEKSVLTLASFEKPLLNLKINSIFKENHPKAEQFCDVKGASDIFIFKLFEKLYENDIFFIGVKTTAKPLKVAVLDDEIVVLESGEFNLGEDEILKDEISKDKTSKDKTSKIELNLGAGETIKFNSISLLKFKNFSSFKELKDEILADKTGEKLYQNFTKFHKFPDGKIDESQNFIGILEILARVLFDKDYHYLIEMAKDHLGKKGPRLDFYLKDGFFDTARLVKTAMSYKLAGVSDRILSFGVIESLIYFCDDFLSDLKSELEFDGVVVGGEILAHKNSLNLAKNLLSSELNFRFKQPLLG